MNFETALQLAVLACIGVGVVGLVYPPMVFLPSRWIAAAILLFMLVPLGAAIEFYPVAGADPADGATFGFAICWFVIVGAVARFRSLRRRAVGHSPDQPSAGIWASIKNSWADVQKAEQERLARKRALDAKGEAFDQRVKERRMQIAQRKRDGAVGSSTVVPILLDPAYAPDAVLQGSGDNVLKFEYADADGVLTVRTIRNWTDDGIYLRGWCEDRRAVRTFRMDRVIEWF